MARLRRSGKAQLEGSGERITKTQVGTSVMLLAIALGLSFPLRAAQPASPAQPPGVDLNPAGLEIGLQPDGSVPVGTRFTFRLTSRQAGYLLILDVNAEGSVTQIYPNVFSLKLAREAVVRGEGQCSGSAYANTLSAHGFAAGADPTSNHLDPGEVFELPGEKSRAGYSFQACPPLGPGFVAAILSERPVQLVDLPDLPAALVSQPTGPERLIASLRSLHLLTSDAPEEQTANVRWSVAVKRYTIVAPR